MAFEIVHGPVKALVDPLSIFVPVWSRNRFAYTEEVETQTECFGL